MSDEGRGVLITGGTGCIIVGLFTPQFAGTDSVLLAAGILGATVMLHVIYCTRP